MSIKDVEVLNNRQIETLRRKQNREIKRMDEGHDNMKAETKKSHANELVDLQHENIKQVASESDKKGKVLEQMKTHLDATKKMTDRQIKDLKDYTSKTKQEEHAKLSVDRDRLKQENDLYLEELQYRFAKEHKQINQSGQQEIANLKRIRGEEVTDQNAQHQEKISHLSQDFTEKYQRDTHNYKKIKDDQDKVFKQERLNTNVKQQQDMTKLTTAHASHIEVRDGEYRKGLKVQDQDFEKKYADNLKFRGAELKQLEDLNKKVVEKMKDGMAQELKTSIIRSDDPFYAFTELKPTLKKFEDRVEISVTIPDHAKEDLQLTINGKQAIVNFNRRYDDTHKAPDKSINKVHKVESFSTRLETGHHLDPKSVKSVFDGGVMTYTIKHA